MDRDETLTYRLDKFVLQSGREIHNAELRYVLHGALNELRSNAILFPTWFAGTSKANEWIVGPGRGLDTDKFCVVVVNAFGNGQSSSASNHPQMIEDGVPIPITLLDNVRAQRELIRSLGIEKLHAIVGRSMGAQQALQWGCMYPQLTSRIFAFCGTPATTPHNRILLESMALVLEGSTRRGEPADVVLRRAAMVYAGWVVSHEFFNDRELGSEAGDWVSATIVPAFLGFDPRDLLSLVRTWQDADISRNDVYQGDLVRALAAIEARVFVMPISHDLIFPPQDFELVEKQVASSTSRILYSKWGHRAGAPGSDARDIAMLETELRGFISSQGDTAWQLSAQLGMLWPM